MTSTVYWGYSATASPTAAQVQALAHNKSHGSYCDSYEFNGPAGGQYAVLAFPSEVLVSEVFYEDSVFGNFNTILVTITVDGDAIDYVVFVSSDVRYELGDLTVAARVGPYEAVASDYNEASYGTRGGALTGLVNGKKLTMSAWVSFKAGNGNGFTILADFAGHWSLVRTSGNKFQLQVRNTGNNVLLTLTSTSSFYSSSNFYHVLVSVDLAMASSARMYVNDVLEAGPTTGTIDDIDLVDTDYYLGHVGGGNPNTLLGCLSEVLIHPDYLDLSVEANRRKFRSVYGKPVRLGLTGQGPFGITPLIYMPEGDPTENLGTGGNFSPTGTFPACEETPGEIVTESIAWNRYDIRTQNNPVLVYSNSDRTVTNTAGSNSVAMRVTGLPRSTGKVYWEMEVVGNVPGAFEELGAGGTGSLASGEFSGGFAVKADGSIYNATTINGSVLSSFSGIYAPAPNSGAYRYGFAVDFATSKVWISVNGAYLVSGNPAAGLNNTCGIPAGAELLPSGRINSLAGITGSYKAADFVYAPPSGFSAWDQTP